MANATSNGSETVVRFKLWPIIGLIAMAIAYLFVCGQQLEGRVSRIEGTYTELSARIGRMHQEQDLYFTLRDPRWQDVKKTALPKGS